MNVNILPMDVLPIVQPEPVKGLSSHRLAQKHDFEQIGKQDNDLVSQTRRNDTGNNDFSLNSTAQDAKASDNINSETHNIHHKCHNKRFEDCLKRQIKTDDPCDEETSSEDTTGGQDIDKIDKQRQVQLANGLQAVVSVSVGQSESANKTPESSQPTQPVASIEKVIPADNQQKVSQQDTVQQGQPALGNFKNDQNLKQSSAVTDTLVLTVPQKEQTKNPQPQDAGNNQKNDQPKSASTSTDVSKTNASVNYDNFNELPDADSDNKLNDIASQSGVVQPKGQLVTTLSQQIAVSANVEQPIESKITKGRQQGGREQNASNTENNSSKDNSAGLFNTQGNRLDNELITGGLVARPGVEKIEMVNGKDGSANSQPVNLAPLISHGQVADSKSADVIDISRSTVADAGKSIAGNNASSDASASVREQIYESVQAAANQVNQQITIQLNPPELGKVSLKFSQIGAELSGLVEADNPQTRAEIRHAIPEILRSLEQSGITVKRIDVALCDLSGKSDLSRQSNQESFRDHFSQMAWDRSDSQNYQDSGRQPSCYDSFSGSSYSSLIAGDSSAEGETSPTGGSLETRVTGSESRANISPDYAVSGLDVLI